MPMELRVTSTPPPRVPTETSSPAIRGLCLALVAAALAMSGCGYKGDLMQADAAQEAESETGDEDADAKPSAQED